MELMFKQKQETITRTRTEERTETRTRLFSMTDYISMTTRRQAREKRKQLEKEALELAEKLKPAEISDFEELGGETRNSIIFEFIQARLREEEQKKLREEGKLSYPETITILKEKEPDKPKKSNAKERKEDPVRYFVGRLWELHTEKAEKEDNMTTIYVCLIMAKMMDYAKKAIDENADGIEDCLKNPKDKGKYINGDDAKKEKGLNAILDDAKATFENKAAQTKEYMADEVYSTIRDNVNDITNAMLEYPTMDINSTIKAKSVNIDGKQFKRKTIISLSELRMVSQLLKGASEMVEGEDVKNAAQTAIKKIDEIDFGPLKKGELGKAYKRVSSKSRNFMKAIGQIVRDEMGMIL